MFFEMTDEEKFERIYGKGAFSRLRLLLKNLSLTYEDIGREFGLTKQRIGQLAQLVGINGFQRKSEAAKERPPYVANRNHNYTPTVRLVLGELTRRGITFEPHYTLLKRNSRIMYKSLSIVRINGVPCKVSCRNMKRQDGYTFFKVSAETMKAKAVVWGVRYRGKVRLYVIPVSELKNIRGVYFPVRGRYIKFSRSNS